MMPRVCDGNDCDYDGNGNWAHYGSCQPITSDSEDAEAYDIWLIRACT